MSATRDHIIEATCELLEMQGYHATGLSQIIAESGAPRGSLYYYFPAGKEELAAAAIDKTGKLVAQRITAGLARIEEPAEAVRQFVYTIAYHVEASGFRSGGPLMTVAMETATSSERLNLACREAYQMLLEAFAQKLISSGIHTAQAERLAIFIISAIEGGVMLSRTGHSGDPLRCVAEELAAFLRSALR